MDCENSDTSSESSYDPEEDDDLSTIEESTECEDSETLNSEESDDGSDDDYEYDDFVLYDQDELDQELHDLIRDAGYLYRIGQ